MDPYDYKAAVKVMVNNGLITRFSELLEYVPVTPLANAMRSNWRAFTTKMKKGKPFKEKQVNGMAEFLGIPIEKLQGLIEADRIARGSQSDKVNKS